MPLTPDIPLFIVWLGGIIAAILRWKKSPRSSLFALLGIVVISLLHLLQRVLNYVYPIPANIYGVRLRDIGTVSVAVKAVGNFVRAIGWVLVLTAIFVNKGTKAEKQESPDQSPASSPDP